MSWFYVLLGSIIFNSVLSGAEHYDNTTAIMKQKKHIGPCGNCAHLPSYQFLFNSWRRIRQRPRRNSDCDTLYRTGVTMDGVQVINVNRQDLRVYCDFDNMGQNYVVIQRRTSATLDFDKEFSFYVNGFGDLTGDFWLGLNAMYQLSHHLRRPVLRIEISDATGSTYAEYRFFRVLSGGRKFALRVAGYSGNAGDGLRYHDYAPFSTRDHDNDCERWERNCAEMFGGGWWYKDCFAVNLNARHAGTAANMDGITWYYWRKNFDPLTTTLMSLRNGN